MLKSVINSFVKTNNRKVAKSPANKRAWLQESTLADHRSAGFNPKRARYKSVKGISIFNKEV